ncbi:MAG: adenine nucleotide alpha hydrolase family protein [Anaerolineae bacterium]|nr:adenine nucleotide alpha hydrolase family protein [Anaerolineae bacterium]
MRCRKCGQPAAINMRQHKLALCETHYTEWFIAQTQRAIEKYHMFGPEERVLVAVSGGKDSLALWDVLLKLGYQADGLYIDLGIGAAAEGVGYSQASRQKIERFLAGRPGARYTVVDLLGEYGETLPEVAGRVRRGHDKPCSVCGLIKRHEMNRVAREGGYGVLVTGHNLDDEVAVLFGNVLHWQTGYIARQAPVLQEEAGLARKAKPFCRFYERETTAYALINGIDYIYDECPYAVGATSLAYKDVLNRMEGESPGTKLQFYLGFLRARQAGFFREEIENVTLTPCPRCGQPTSAQGLCTFCRLWERQTASATPPPPSA